MKIEKNEDFINEIKENLRRLHVEDVSVVARCILKLVIEYHKDQLENVLMDKLYLLLEEKTNDVVEVVCKYFNIRRHYASGNKAIESNEIVTEPSSLSESLTNRVGLKKPSARLQLSRNVKYNVAKPRKTAHMKWTDIARCAKADGKRKMDIPCCDLMENGVCMKADACRFTHRYGAVIKSRVTKFTSYYNTPKEKIDYRSCILPEQNGYYDKVKKLPGGLQDEVISISSSDNERHVDLRSPPTIFEPPTILDSARWYQEMGLVISETDTDCSSYKPTIHRHKTLIVSNIPKHLNNVSVLDRYFRKFGSIRKVTVNFKKDESRALVEFRLSKDMAAANKSVDAVLGNRFIKTKPYKKNKRKERQRHEASDRSTSTECKNSPKRRRSHSSKKRTNTFHSHVRKISPNIDRGPSPNMRPNTFYSNARKISPNLDRGPSQNKRPNTFHSNVRNISPNLGRGPSPNKRPGSFYSHLRKISPDLDRGPSPNKRPGSFYSHLRKISPNLGHGPSNNNRQTICSNRIEKSFPDRTKSPKQKEPFGANKQRELFTSKIERRIPSVEFRQSTSREKSPARQIIKRDKKRSQSKESGEYTEDISSGSESSPRGHIIKPDPFEKSNRPINTRMSRKSEMARMSKMEVEEPMKITVVSNTNDITMEDTSVSSNKIMSENVPSCSNATMNLSPQGPQLMEVEEPEYDRDDVKLERALNDSDVDSMHSDDALSRTKRNVVLDSLRKHLQEDNMRNNLQKKLTRTTESLNYYKTILEELIVEYRRNDKQGKSRVVPRIKEAHAKYMDLKTLYASISKSIEAEDLRLRDPVDGQISSLGSSIEAQVTVADADGSMIHDPCNIYIEVPSDIILDPIQIQTHLGSELKVDNMEKWPSANNGTCYVISMPTPASAIAALEFLTTNNPMHWHIGMKPPQ